MERLEGIAADIGRTAAYTEQLKQSGMREKKIMAEVRKRYTEASEKHFDSLEGIGMGSQDRYKQVAMSELKNLKDARMKCLDAAEKHYDSLEELEVMSERYKREIRNYAKSLNPKELTCETEDDIYRFYCISILAAYEGDALIQEAKAGNEWLKLVRELKIQAKVVKPSGERARVKLTQLHSGQGQPLSSSPQSHKRSRGDAGH